MRSLFLFHRDLRLYDNTALSQCINRSDEVMLVFVFPPDQIDARKNKYFSNAAVQFMCESLCELSDNVHLHFFKGEYVEVLSTIHKHYKFDRLYHNEDYSVYARKRDAAILEWCKENNVDHCSYEDYGLFGLNEGMLPDGRPYTVLAQFYKNYLKHQDLIRKVDKAKIDVSKVATKKIPGEIKVNDIHDFYTSNLNIAQHGGRNEAMKILKRIGSFSTYKDTRDYPAKVAGTTRISAHLKFGTISVREMYWACVRAFGTRDHPLIRELIFREFYMKIYGLKPELQRGVAYLSDLDKNMKWSYDKKLFEAWKNGMTGYPLVDAGMRQLARENWCHNRVRMLVASVATKYFLLDWRDCARYFYTQLVDADTYSNTAGWGWASSTGVDATLYFRAPFNPYIQSKKFDANAEYIKRFVPELQDVETKDIHKWYDPVVRSKYPGIQYPGPIVDHREASARALRVFKSAKSPRS